MAAFENVVQALQVLDAIGRLPRDEMTGRCDAVFVDASADELADSLRSALGG